MELRYLPATVPDRVWLTARQWETLGVPEDHRTPTGWLDPYGSADSPGRYPNILISYYHWQKQRFAFPDGTFIFGDSGGYSVMTLGANVDPLAVLRWQALNTTVGCVLDVPPFATTKAGNEVGWDTGLARTVGYTRTALPVYEEMRDRGHPFKWWGVIHGRAWVEMEAWYEQLADVYPFRDEGEGWAFKAFPSNNVEAIAQALGFLGQKGITRAHSLMTAGPREVAVLSVFGRRAGLAWLTFDASSADGYAVNRKLLVPDGLRVRVVIERERTGDTPATDYMMRCPCPSCILLRAEFPDGPPRKGKYLSQRILFHNVLAYRQVFAQVHREATGQPEAVLVELLGRRYSSVMRAFEGQAPTSVAAGTPRSLLDMI